MALRSTQPLTEMSTRNLPGGKGQPASKVDNLTVIYEPIVYKVWEPRRLTTLMASTACYRGSFTFSITWRLRKLVYPVLSQVPGAVVFQFSSRLLPVVFVVRA
jgi:hypothetical protein